MSRPDSTDDPHRFIDGERYLSPRPAELDELMSLDAQPDAGLLNGWRTDAEVSGDVQGVHAEGQLLEVPTLESPHIYNAFWIPGKVPSLNDLLDAKSKNQPRFRSIIMRQKPQKGKGGARYCLYNEIKQDWKQRTIRALFANPVVPVASAHFGYVVVEDSLKRDPSNICSAAVKFIEDGLVEAGVIPNDGWSQVLGIRVHWLYRKGREPGVYVVMSDVPLYEDQLALEYEKHFDGQIHLPKE